MAPRCLPGAPYKGIFALLFIFIAVEYFFNTVSDTKKALFFNTTNRSTTAHRYCLALAIAVLIATNAYNYYRLPRRAYGPLLKTLLFKNKAGNATNATTTLPRPPSNFNYVITHPPGLYNTTTAANMSGVAALFDLSTAEPANVSGGAQPSDVPPCPEVSQYLYGKVAIQRTPVPSVAELERKFSWLRPGGHWAPTACRVLKRVAIIIPFRCRGEHLLVFLNHMHPFLRRQQLDYTVFVVEQDGGAPFNRAALMNVGYVEALRRADYDCFVFHDVDLLPEDDRNLYTCPDQPRHMSVAVDIFKYRLPYPAIFGGVSAISREHFQLLNGFSNSFWGWGGEDDDMSNRIRYHHLHISRYPLTIARYTMLSHKKDKPSPNRYDMLKQGQKRFDNDGLNSLQYKLLASKENLLYTWILVAFEPPKVR